MASYNIIHLLGDISWGRTYDIKLDDTSCSNDDWNSCSYNTDHDCSHIEDVYLSCEFPKGKLLLDPAVAYHSCVIWCNINSCNKLVLFFDV